MVKNVIIGSLLRLHIITFCELEFVYRGLGQKTYYYNSILFNDIQLFQFRRKKVLPNGYSFSELFFIRQSNLTKKLNLNLFPDCVL